jgi:AcrR family transcriptional regulator
VGCASWREEFRALSESEVRMSKRATSIKKDASRPDRRPGRPRSGRAHASILDAAVELFIRGGSEGMSVEAVALRAGVGKATIYRRWPSKEELLIEAIEHVFAEPPTRDTGSVRDDLALIGRDLHKLMTSRLTGGVFPPMAAEVARGSRLGRLYGQRVIAPRRAVLEQALRRGIDRGELSGDFDLELAIDLLVGMFLLRRLTDRLMRSDSELPDRAVDIVLTGVSEA